MARYFAFGQPAASQKGSESFSDNGIQTLTPAAIPDAPQLSPETEELGVAMPSFPGNDRNAPKSPFRAAILKSAGTGRAAQSHITGLNTTAQLFNSSFNNFFSSVFKRTKNEDALQTVKQEVSQSSKEDTAQAQPNPFTAARQKLVSNASPAASDNKTEVAQSAPQTQNSPQQNQQTTDSTAVAAGSGVSTLDQFLIVGDFTGSGILSSLKAVRQGDAVFISDDGERGLNLYINTDAVEQSSAFYIDDINGDGITDLLVTSGAALFGGVLLGDGSGGYRLADKFLTGYEPIVPSVGPIQNGMRDILTLDTRSGILTTFVSQDHYRAVQSQQLSFLPSYLLHMVAPDTSRDYVMAAQTGGAEKILAWGDNNLLQAFADTLGEDPTVLSSSYDSTSSLQGLQVGNYASIILSRQGRSFNVANMRILPNTFLVLGDFYRRGSLDVAVGSLTYFRKKQ